MLQALLVDGLWGGLLMVLKISLILTPLLVFMTVAREMGWIEAWSRKLLFFSKFLRLPQEAMLPLLVGLIFGVVYGAAIIMDTAKEGLIKKEDLLLVGVFLSLNHGIIEDTLIFAAAGANPFVVLTFRFLLSLFLTRLVARYQDKGNFLAPFTTKNSNPQ